MLHTLLLKCQRNSDEQKEAKEKPTNSPALSSMPPACCGIELTSKVWGGDGGCPCIPESYHLHQNAL